VILENFCYITFVLVAKSFLLRQWIKTNNEMRLLSEWEEFQEGKKSFLSRLLDRKKRGFFDQNLIANDILRSPSLSHAVQCN